MQPPEALRDWLEYWRAAGRPFAEAWVLSLNRSCRGYPGGPAWAELLSGQRATWQRAYDGEAPTAAERALGMLVEGVTGDPDSHPCAHCDKPIPVERLAHRAEFCSERCRKAASWKRERLRGPSTRSDGRVSVTAERPSGALAVSGDCLSPAIRE